MSENDCTFDSSRLQPYEIGAALAVILASPPSVGDEEERSRFHTALCSEALRERCKWDDEWANQAQLIKPIYAFHPLRAVKRDMNTINRRITERLQAAHIAIAYLKEAETGQMPELPKGTKRLSINELVLALSETNDIDVDNFETRVWRPSLPVIHLAVAFAINIDMAEKQNKKTSLGDLIFDEAMIADIITEAEKHEALVEKSKIQIKLENLVKVRLA